MTTSVRLTACLCLTLTTCGGASSSGPCTGVICAAGTVCANGSCLPFSCPSHACGQGQVCLSAACVDITCVDLNCSSGDVCIAGTCVPSAGTSGAMSTTSTSGAVTTSSGTSGHSGASGHSSSTSGSGATSTPGNASSTTGSSATSTSGSASGTTGSSSGAPCSPNNYTQITNAQPMPYDFCAYAGLPFRALLPANPQSIDQTNTAILQQQYIPNSGPSGSPQREMYTDGVYPPPSVGGSSMYVVYVASSTDPLITVQCSSAVYGCSSALSSVSTLPAFHIPAGARPSYPSGDNGLEVIQPDGTTFGLYWISCDAFADFTDGEVIGSGSDPCASGFQGAHEDNIVTGMGVNPGNVSGGDDLSALPAHYNEVIAGQINHALVVTAGCFTGSVYPGAGAAPCNATKGIPSGSHLWLNLTHAQIDALPTSTVPASMRVFLYAAHDYGIYAFDTGTGTPWISEPIIEDPLPQMIFGGTNPWTTWFAANGGSLAGDGTLKTWNTIDWSPLAANMFVLDACYARGTCSDSIAVN